MAKQVGLKKITGSYDGICFYVREGEWLARAESSLDRKRYYKDPVFEGSRRSNERMAKASPLASKLYKFITAELKGRPVFNKLVGQIKVRIKEGWNESRICVWFNEEYSDMMDKALVEVQPGKVKKTSKKRSTCYFPGKMYKTVFVQIHKPVIRKFTRDALKYRTRRIKSVSD